MIFFKQIQMGIQLWVNYDEIKNLMVVFIFTNNILKLFYFYIIKYKWNNVSPIYQNIKFNLHKPPNEKNIISGRGKITCLISRFLSVDVLNGHKDYINCRIMLIIFFIFARVWSSANNLHILLEYLVQVTLYL